LTTNRSTARTRPHLYQICRWS